MALKLFSKEPTTATTDQSKSEADALIERLGTVIEDRIKAAVTPLTEKVEAVSNWQKKIEEEVSKPPATTEADKDVTPEQKDLNEKRALLAMNIQTNARFTETECLNQLRGQWDHLIPKVQEWFKATAIEVKAKPDYAAYCERVVNMAIGEDARKAGLRYNKTSGRFLIEDSAGSKDHDGNPMLSGDLDWVDPHSGKVETADQTLRKMGIDPKKFAEEMKGGVS
jgi:hypothetical protein